MKKIPFSLDFKEGIIAGKVNVETRDGRNVRIVCFDLNDKGGKHIVGIVDMWGENELPFTFNDDGRYYDDSMDVLDLFVVINNE